MDKDFSNKEIFSFREILRKSIGEYSNQFTDEEIKEIAITLLQTTAVILKTKNKLRKLT